MAVPILTMVEPHCIACTMSLLIPTDRVSKLLIDVWYWSNNSFSAVSVASCSSIEGLAFGIAIIPRNVRLGWSLINATNEASSAGATPDLLSSSSILTWIQMFKGAQPWGRWSFNLRAIFSLSTVCTQSKCSATAFVLFDWIGTVSYTHLTLPTILLV